MIHDTYVIFFVTGTGEGKNPERGAQEGRAKDLQRKGRVEGTVGGRPYRFQRKVCHMEGEGRARRPPRHSAGRARSSGRS